MLNNSVSNKSFIIKTLLYGSAIIVIIVALLLGSFMPQNVVYADSEDSYIVFNQLFDNVSSVSDWNTISRSINNYKITFNGYFTSYNAFAGVGRNIDLIQNHKYFLKFNLINNNTTQVNLRLGTSMGGTNHQYNVGNNAQIITPNINDTCDIGLLVYSQQNSQSNPYDFSITPQLIDLTKMYGDTYANTLTVEQCEKLFPTIYSYNLGTVISESNATDYASGYVDGVNDTLNNFTVNATMGDSYNFLTTVDYQNYASKITKEIITINNQQYYGCVCLGYVKLPFYIRGSTSLKLNILAFGPWGAGADMDPTIYYDIGYIYNGEFINLYNTSMPKTADGIQNAEFEFFIPVDIDGIVFNCSEQYMLVNITAQYITYDVQDAIYKAEQRGYDNGHDNGYKLGKAEGYELGSRSTDNLLIGGFWNWFTSMLGSISSILDIELYGGISIGVVILVPLLFTVLLLVLKLVRGNG